MADEIVNLKHNGKHVAPLNRVIVPARHSLTGGIRPIDLVNVLEDCDGDINLFIEHFHATSHESKMSVLVKALEILSEDGAEAQLARFERLRNAYKHAKIMMAEHTAFECIGNYKPPMKKTKNGPAQMTPSTFVSYAGMWMKDHLAETSTRGRLTAHDKKEATKKPAADPGGSILARLQQAKEEEDE